MVDTTKSYTPKEWVEGEIIYSTDLNHMEQGISNQMVGPTGPTGATGARGAVGQAGVQGPKGDDGAVGPVGPQGLQGERGLQGVKGEKGDTGAQGPQGEQGIQGEEGPQGPAGPAGEGTGGEPGPAGPQGEQGLTGPQGPVGATGPVGPQGPKGDQGEAGDDGATGPQGPQGLRGATGPAGPRGDTGATGPAGPTGPQGPTGATGPANTKGIASFSISLASDSTYIASSITLQDGTVIRPTILRVNPAIPKYISISQTGATSLEIILEQNQDVSTYLWYVSTSATATTPVIANSTHFVKSYNGQNAGTFTVNIILPTHTVGQTLYVSTWGFSKQPVGTTDAEKRQWLINNVASASRATSQFIAKY